MPISLLCWAGPNDYLKKYDAPSASADYLAMYRERKARREIVTLKGTDAAFSNPASAEEREIYWLIVSWDAEETIRLENELFIQRGLLSQVVSELSGGSSAPKLKRRSALIASLADITTALSAIQRSSPLEEDRRLFQGAHAPVLENIRGVAGVRPMRFGPDQRHEHAGAGIALEARQEDLLCDSNVSFGRYHCAIAVDAFYALGTHTSSSAAARTVFEMRRAQRRFESHSGDELMIACLCTEPASGLKTAEFVPVTQPPEEHHDSSPLRRLVHLLPGDVMRWLRPGLVNQVELLAILNTPSGQDYGLRDDL